MKFLQLILLILLIIAQGLRHPAKGQNKITVTITNIRNNNGHILISLFNHEKGWPEDEANTLIKTEFPIQNGKAFIVFNNMPKGVYAVAIMHDENDNYKMDYNFFRLPKEGYGFSNDVMGTFGPPGFKEASFKHELATEVKIKIRY
ncbi:MAG: DUF2141 domain-containing protein [Bacteroidia bacterium]